MKLLKTFLAVLFLPAILAGKCTLTKNQNGGSVYCTKINQEKYISSIFEFGQNIQDIVKQNFSSKFSVSIFNAHIPRIEEWIYLPWQQIKEAINNVPLVYSLVIVNSSVEHVDLEVFGGFSILEILDLSGNNISDYSFLRNIERLKHLHLSYSNFNLDYESVLYRYIVRNDNLKLVNFSHCNFSRITLPPKYSSSLYVDLSYNLILQTIDMNYYNGKGNGLNIDGSYQLKYLNFFGPYLKMSDLKNNFNYSLLTNITTNSLTLRNNDIYSLNSSIFNLRRIIEFANSYIDLSNTKLKFISGAYFSRYNLKSLILSGNNLTKLTNYTFNNSLIENLDLSNSKITYIDSTVFFGSKITNLNLAFNSIKFIDKETFASCGSLKVLNLTNCYIRSFGTDSFAHLHHLKHMEISFSGTINGKNIRNQFLRTLVIRNSNITSLQDNNFVAFNNLRQLDFPGTSVKSVGLLVLKGLFNIKEIDLNNMFGNTFYKPIFQNISSLEHLDLSHKNIRVLTGNDFKGLVRLQTLNVSCNLITNIDMQLFSDLGNLSVLSFSFNKLSQLPNGVFSNLKNLTYLYLDNNGITSLTGILSGLENLIYLDVSFNKISNSVVFPNNLKYLNFQQNRMPYDLMTIKYHKDFFSLKWIDINGGGWCNDLALLLSFFKKNGISSKPLNPVYSKININGIVCH